MSLANGPRYAFCRQINAFQGLQSMAQELMDQAYGTVEQWTVAALKALQRDDKISISEMGPLWFPYESTLHSVTLSGPWFLCLAWPLKNTCRSEIWNSSCLKGSVDSLLFFVLLRRVYMGKPPRIGAVKFVDSAQQPPCLAGTLTVLYAMCSFPQIYKQSLAWLRTLHVRPKTHAYRTVSSPSDQTKSDIERN